jgi:hypothetical protein
MPDLIPAMRVKVRDNRAESERWGYGRGGPIVRTVIVPWVCPACGGPRGEVRGLNSCDDGDYFHVNVWDNACGHVDMYDDVLDEAGMRAPKNPQRPRVMTYRHDDHINAYKIPQREWRPDMTEGDCQRAAAADTWALPDPR